MNYAMITPVKNEAKYIRQTIESVIAQTLKPELWVIIDGGSTDKTRDIVKEYREKYPWIVLRHELRFSGKCSHLNVSYAMDEAYDYIRSSGAPFDYLWTIDGDQTLEPGVCAGVIREIEKDSSLGVASGQVYNGTIPDVYPRGELPNKRVYRRTALDEIMGFPTTKYSFDTVILAKLRIRNWGITTFPEYRITNLRADSGIERNAWKAYIQFGKARYYLGYSFSLLVAGCGYLVLQFKVLKSIGIFCGWMESWICRDEIITDKEIRDHFHYDRLKEVLIP